MASSGMVKKWLSDQGLFLIVITGLTVTVGILIAEVQTKLGWKSVAVGVATIVLLDAVLIIFLKLPLQRALSLEIETLSRRIQQQSIQWLLDTEGLAQLEERSKADEIWLLTHDLLDDIGGRFQEVVRSNTKRGVKYTYFVPNTPEIKARVSRLNAVQHKTPAVIYLPPTFFFLMPNLDIVIYNPVGADTNNRLAYMGLPAFGEIEHYHARVSNEFVDVIVGTLLTQCKAELDERLLM